MFTDKYIAFPVKEYSEEEKELTGKENCRNTTEKIDPFQISNYRTSTDNEGTDCVTVILKSGYIVCVYLPVYEFEKLLNDSQK